jgi:hypothetical protein
MHTAAQDAVGFPALHAVAKFCAEMCLHMSARYPRTCGRG